jgi:hypothetical protein
MAKSAAERQRAYRERRKDEGSARLDFIIPAHTASELGRLAAHYGVTRSQALERIVAEAHRAMIDAMPEEQRAQFYSRL